MLPMRQREYHDGIDDGLLVIVMRAAQPGKHVAAARTVRGKKMSHTQVSERNPQRERKSTRRD